MLWTYEHNKDSNEPAQSDLCLHSLHEETLYPWGSKMCQWWFWSDNVNAQADLNLHLSHMSKGKAPDKVLFSIKNCWYFSYSSTKTEALLMSTHNVYFFLWRNKKYIFLTPPLFWSYTNVRLCDIVARWGRFLRTFRIKRRFTRGLLFAVLMTINHIFTKLSVPPETIKWLISNVAPVPCVLAWKQVRAPSCAWTGCSNPQTKASHRIIWKRK